MSETTYTEEIFATPIAAEENPGYEVNNREMNLAWKLIANTGTSVFLTGKAGTGKTTFLRKLRDMLPKRMVVLAPTGVAAINAQGQTIHSFFQLPFGPLPPDGSANRRSNFKMSTEKKKLIRTLDLLVIDEISMVRCDLLDAIDAELRKYKNRYKPFGGVQLLLIGDLQQLAPVAKESEWELLKPYYPSPYFFNSIALKKIKYATVELKHIYRQKDAEFIDILGKIRTNTADAATFATLNARVIPDFTVPEGEDWIRLTTHNRMADEYNNHMMDSLPTEERIFTAHVEGNFPESNYPAEPELPLKEGAQVMFIKNDPSGMHQYYNGKIGVITEISDNGIEIYSKEDGTTVTASPVTWENTKYVLDEHTAEIKEKVEGVFTQIPLRPAWAITVHKSQGLTFDHAVLDINSSFAHGQTYVALSRCRSLDGMVLSQRINPHAIISDSSVLDFMDQSAASASEIEAGIGALAKDYLLQLLNEAFDFHPLVSDVRYIRHILQEHAAKVYPEYISVLEGIAAQMDTDLVAVAERFAVWYRSMVHASEHPETNQIFQDKIANGCRYYLEKMEQTSSPVLHHESLQLANRHVVQQLTTAFNAFRETYELKKTILTIIGAEGFTVRNYLEAKARGSLTTERKTAGTLSGVKRTEKKQRNTSHTPARDVKYESAMKPWTRELDEQVIELFMQGTKKAEIARMLGRSPGAISSRIKKLLGK